MAISDFNRDSFPASSATPVLPWWAQLFALPGRMVIDVVDWRRRRAARDQLERFSDHQLRDLGLERGLGEARRSDKSDVRRAQRWLSTPTD